MVKTILAIIGLNFLIDHPYIALGLVCAIGYLIYWGIQQKNSQDNAEAAPAPMPPPVQNAYGDEELTPGERQRISDEINYLNGEKQRRALTDEENTRLGLLSMKMFQWQTRTMTPDDRTVYLRLIGKYMNGEGLTAAERKQFDRLRAIAERNA